MVSPPFSPGAPRRYVGAGESRPAEFLYGARLEGAAPRVNLRTEAGLLTAKEELLCRDARRAEESSPQTKS